MPAVGVIVPTYNRAALLREAIASILAQTYGDLEVIVVDDGSADETESVCSGTTDPRLRYVRQEHAERSVARNRGLSVAGGEYVAFLDDDDVYLPDKLALQVAYLQSHPDVDLVASGYRLVDAGGQLLSVQRPWLSHPELGPRSCLVGGCPIVSTVTMRRAVLSGRTRWFHPGLSPAEDADFFIALALDGCRMRWLEEIVADYRQWRPPSGQAAAYSFRGAEVVIERALAHPGLPPDIRREANSIRARWDMAWAWRAYLARQTHRARFLLLRGVVRHPALTEESDGLPGSLAHFARQLGDVGNDPDAILAFIKQVVHDLPAPLGVPDGFLESVRASLDDRLNSLPEGPAGAGAAMGGRAARAEG